MSGPQYGRLTAAMHELAEWRVEHNPEGYGRLRPASQKGRGAGPLTCLKCGMLITHPHKESCPTLEQEQVQRIRMRRRRKLRSGQ